MAWNKWLFLVVSLFLTATSVAPRATALPDLPIITLPDDPGKKIALPYGGHCNNSGTGPKDDWDCDGLSNEADNDDDNDGVPDTCDTHPFSNPDDRIERTQDFLDMKTRGCVSQ